VIGASVPHTYQIAGEPWSEQGIGVYLPAQSPLAESSEVEITTMDGRVETLPVVGTYRMMLNPTTMWVSTGVLMPLELSRRLTTPDTFRVYADVHPDQITTLLSTLRDATVIDLAMYVARFTQNYYSLYIIAAVFSGLALLAGLLLIANAVSLAMLDRQYEIGVLKTIGYTRRDLLLTLVVEYGAVALIVSAAGIALVQLLLFAIGIANGLAARILVMSVSDMLFICAIVLALMLFTVLLVTWQPIRRSAVFILNDRV
jgi:predicted lysophospholipase L1 biosynthesis ABC-type transport system permease subunit